MTAVFSLTLSCILRLAISAATVSAVIITAVGRTAATVFGGAIELGARLIAPGFLAVRAGLKAMSVQLALAATIFFGAIAWGIMHSDLVRDEFVATDARATSPAIYDVTDQFVGAFPSRQNLDDPTQDFADYVSIHGEKQPIYLWACLKHLEDRRFGAWYVSRLGFDPVSAGRTLLALSVGRGGGHSNLPNQLSRSMRGTFPGDAEAPGQKLERKLTEWSDSPALTYLLSRDGADGAQFVLSNLALISGASGSHAGSLPYGAEAASLIVFHRPAAALDVAQQYMLAAANWRPIRVAPENNVEALRDVDHRWSILKQRAARCMPLVADSPDYEGIRAELAALPPPRLTDRTLVTKEDASIGFATAVNPVRRLRLLLGDGGLRQIKHDLDGDGKGDWRGRVIQAHLAFDAARNFTFSKKVTAILDVLQRRLGNRLQLRLIGSDSGSTPAQVLAVLADAETGDVLRFYESGPVNAFDQRRPLASLGKALVAAPVLARVDTPLSAYCNRAIVGISNAGGNAGAGNCRTPGAYVLARDVYARSMSLPLINRLSQLNPLAIRETAASLGFTLPSDIPPATSVPEGLFEATPRAALQGMIALSRALAGMTGDVPAPHMLVSVSSIITGGAVDTDRPAGNDLHWGVVRQATWPVSTYLREMLAAPLSSGGTLAGLRQFRPAEDSAFIFDVGKTGTSVTPTKFTRDAMIVGAFQLAHSRHVYAYFVLVGTSAPTSPLGNINATAFTPIARLLIEEARNTIR